METARILESESPADIQSIGRLATEGLTETLTPRQLKELDLASRGYTADEVARYEFYDKRTVHRHRGHAVRSMGAKTTAEAIRLAIDSGLLPVEHSRDGFINLSPAELHILELAANGLNRPEIAHVRTASAHTVRTQMRSIYYKINVKNVNHAVRRAFELGIFTPRVTLLS
jgi:DNA-binding CsgD family transcriptional regulator